MSAAEVTTYISLYHLSSYLLYQLNLHGLTMDKKYFIHS
uniref:Uncharacterized protein n=1 Tax=Anguilla anguilla TaxID=7936 RepID=A0A0E9WN92_ANGAN